MPFDDSLPAAALRVVFNVFRTIIELLGEHVFAAIGRGFLFLVTGGRVRMDCERGFERLLCILIGIAVVLAAGSLAIFLIPSLRDTA